MIRENCGEIVVYKNDKSIVLYNQTGQIRALPIYNITQNNTDNVCPFCGSVLSGEKYNYIAKAYFYLLQNSFQTFSSQNNYPNDVNISSLELHENYNPNTANTDTFNGNGFGSGTGDRIGENGLRGYLIRNDSFSRDEDQSQSDYKVVDDSEVDVMELMELPKNIPKYLLITGYYKRFFIEGPKLGSGSYGHVYNCIHILDELVLGEYAVKKIPIGDDMEWLKKAIKEIKIRENIKHKNVVDYNHSWLEMYRMNELCPYIPYLFILMEYCNGDNLYNFIQKIYKGEDLRDSDSISRVSGDDVNYLSDDEVMIIFIDVLNGLNYLHKNFIIHRDLKPSNILLKYGNDSITVMISDFGTCQVFSQKSTKSGFTGTIEYTAPELLISYYNTFKPTDTTVDSVGDTLDTVEVLEDKIDLWSLGVILYYVSYGALPFYSSDMKECVKLIIYSKLKTPAHPKRSKLIHNIIHNLLSKNSGNRMSCDDLLSIPDINKYLGNTEFNQQIRSQICQRFSTQ
ncbi:Protein kinase domain protein [Theileria parva strain Muguga]|uniref:Serine/threonine protein kinase, putative n=1 Tax=Theileria parva TaxID=5875 RepID=Q4N348_THEPA|nr:Protein kinase domain protein [Theileria parva strain Muguga]EAN31491.1 Protein kinase domain protein [Theileria parva strain Muguga]|eukprot:XP_763774.1 serine/threonine protein kinase [Theileria parva strain Muguga]